MIRKKISLMTGETKSLPSRGLQRWNPYEYTTLAISVSLVFVVVGWLLGDGILSNNIVEQTNYTNATQIDESLLVMDISPLTMDKFPKENDKITNYMIARPPNPEKLEIVSYEVNKGESLWSISQKHSITLDTLVHANPKYLSNSLQPGATLRVPSKNGIFYKVQSGNTLDSIAKEFSVPMDKIMKANEINNPTVIAKNDEIFIPDAKPKITYLATRSGYGWPASGRLSSGFGYRRHPMGGGSRFHRGVDIAAKTGTPIYASRAGKIVHSGYLGLMGKTVIIRHDNEYTTYYGHCSQTLVNVGQRVNRGQLIARVGSTGMSTGSHVHFEVRRNGVPLNPMKYLR